MSVGLLGVISLTAFYLLEVFRGGADELPEQPQLGVPGLQCRVQVVYDPISASYLYHLFSL